MKITFFVPGIPRPGGSKKGYYNAKLKRVLMVEAGKHTATWRGDVRAAAQAAYDGPPSAAPMRFAATFLMPRPKYHYRTGRHAGELKPTAPVWHTVKPDRTKLLRSTEDALKEILWRDDCQVVAGGPLKMYAGQDGRVGALIEVGELSDPEFAARVAALVATELEKCLNGGEPHEQAEEAVGQ